jgi:hypothetical protein
MVRIPAVPTWFRDVNWLLFSGRIANETAVTTILLPSDNANVEMAFATQDILKLMDTASVEQIFVRRYARLARPITISGPPAAASRCSGACGSAGCACIGNLEICCDTDVAVAGCYGYWTC